MQSAYAEDICARVRPFLDNPRFFISAHIKPSGIQRWSTAPLVPGAVCDIWTSRWNDAHNLFCSIDNNLNDANLFYADVSRQMENCLFSDTRRTWIKNEEKVASEGLSGRETIWISDTDTEKYSVRVKFYIFTATDNILNKVEISYLHY